MTEMMFSGSLALLLFLGLLAVALLFIILLKGGVGEAGDALGLAVWS